MSIPLKRGVLILAVVGASSAIAFIGYAGRYQHSGSGVRCVRRLDAALATDETLNRPSRHRCVDTATR